MNHIAHTRQQVKKMKTIYSRLAVLAALLAGTAALAGSGLSPVYYWGAVAAAAPGGMALWAYGRYKRLQELLALRERWGQPVKKERDFAVISLLHAFRHGGSGAPGMVDEQTWRDLNFDHIYALLDRTITAEGQAALYEMLRKPCLSLEPLQERAALIKVFQRDRDFREKVQLALQPLGKRSQSDTTHLLWGPLQPLPPLAPLYTALAAAALLSLSAPLLIGKTGFLVIMALFGLNAIVHQRVSRQYAHLLPAMTSLAALLRAALKVAAIVKPELGGRRERLRESSRVCKALLKKTGLLHQRNFYSDLDFLYDYFNYFFLLEVRAFYASLGEIKKRIAPLREIYDIIAELDALQAVASYRESLPGYIEPDLSGNGAAYIAATDIRHPLLKDPVANSITIDKQGVLITGSNMSGKSTFLRTLGVNAIFAQTIYTCTAYSYRAGFFRVVTSISREDNLAAGKSFYYQEAERLLKLIRAAEQVGETPAFCIIDELLSGTNYTERLAASEAILNYLARKNALVIVATHDLDLAERLQGLYRCCHFTDQVGRDGLSFDYKLKEGISSTRNAIKLLAYLNYPEEIVEQANQKAGEAGRKQ